MGTFSVETGGDYMEWFSSLSNQDKIIELKREIKQTEEDKERGPQLPGNFGEKSYMCPHCNTFETEDYYGLCSSCGTMYQNALEALEELEKV